MTDVHASLLWYGIRESLGIISNTFIYRMSCENFEKVFSYDTLENEFDEYQFTFTPQDILENKHIQNGPYTVIITRLNDIANCRKTAISINSIENIKEYGTITIVSNANGKCVSDIQSKISLLNTMVRKKLKLITKEFQNVNLISYYDPAKGRNPEDSCIDLGGGSKSRRKSSKTQTKTGPQPSAERVMVKGRNRVVYVGPKGGKYIKKDGKFVRL